MRNITLNRTDVNLEALDDALRGALGDALLGVSAGGGTVIVHLVETAPREAETLTRQIAETHRPEVLTPAQQTRMAGRAQRQALDGPVRKLDLDAPLDANGLELAVRWLVARALERE
jgi:hypothetical protein